MADTSLMYVQEKIGKTNSRMLHYVYDITGAKTSSPIIQGVPILTAYDAIAAQSTIDNFLGTSSEFVIAAFDATSMGTDTIAFIFNMGGVNGQAFKVVNAQASFWTGTGAVEVAGYVKAVSTLTNSSLVNEAAVGASGNMALRVTLAGLDAATSGKIDLMVHWISK